MSNPFFTWSFDVPPGSTARSRPVENEFASIGTGFNGVWAYIERGLFAPSGETLDAIPNKATRSGKALAFDATTGQPVALTVASSTEMAAAVAAASTASAAATTATSAASAAQASAESAASSATSAVAPVATATLTGTATLASGGVYHVDTTGGAFTATLPPSPAAGDWVLLRDTARNCATANLTLDRNGSNVYGAAQNYVMDVSGETVLLIVDATLGWIRG